MSSDAHQIAANIINKPEQAWNAADGAAFGAPFTDDADFVAIRGDYHHTGEAIAQGHQHIFDTIYKDSLIRHELMQARTLDENVIIAHAKSTLNAPAGPLAGEHNAVATLIIVHMASEWQIAAFHNTLVAES